MNYGISRMALTMLGLRPSSNPLPEGRAMKKQATKRTIRDLPVKKDNAVKGGFLGSLSKPIGSVVKTTAPIATK
jgi:hypothetical protein